VAEEDLAEAVDAMEVTVVEVEAEEVAEEVAEAAAMAEGVVDVEA